ncbi:MAG: 2-C-methyl-D-erythritol 4-phosphate cytidylyltransferase, partial [Rhizomicrobium sp.]
MRIAVLIVAAGKGERAGGIVPKQYALLKGVPILTRSAAAFAGIGDAVIQVMIGPDQEALYQ